MENCSHKPWGHAPTDSHEPEVNEPEVNGIVESRDQPDRGNPDRGNPVAPSVPIENCTATDLSNTTNLKCPVEMSYKYIKKYFGIGTKELGRGGFGVVYEG